ncbi:MAG: FtsX-like permease family protein [Patescibacteria group bacterium]|nr:FtsX-like permease family protein [Patescibacteria group bacterium]
MQALKEKTKNFLINLKTGSWKTGTFVLLLMVYLLAKAGSFIILILETKTRGLGLKITQGSIFQKITSGLSKFYGRLTLFLDPQRTGTISRIELIELSLRNMKSKKTRTYITIGGMMIGVGAIVFLVSIGYGIEKLVVTRVARLDEMKQADVSPQAGGKIKITDKTLADFKEIPSVEMALPLIAVVGRVNYLNSVTDMAVYGVTTDYLRQSAIKPVEGKVFDSNELSFNVSGLKGEVAGVSTERKTGAVGEKIQDIDFTIDQGTWIRVRESPSITGKILGYTKRVEGAPQGEEVWGGKYETDDNVGKAGETEDGKIIGKWIKSEVLLWKQEKCNPATAGDCEDGKYLVARDEDNKQIQKTGYFAEIGLTLTGVNISEPKVLGVSSDASGSASVNWVDIASEAGIIKTPDTKTVDLSPSAKRQAVVNRAMLAVLGIKESEAVGKKFNTSFVVVGDLLNDPTANIESAKAEYTIVGVTPEEKTPVFYVPFIDLRTLGITNFSQAKVVVKDQNELSKTRRQIESMGYSTRSVADTVAQINSLFATARTVLMLLGMVALAVAALGMFNTLTVSLLERTREVGLMKAMGMKSSEVQELFLTESMIMGFFGGILGIMFGWILGILISIMLSFFAIIKGVGFVNISHIPLPFILVIIFLSLFVGLVTGIYPARRATKISALNALRYE